MIHRYVKENRYGFPGLCFTYTPQMQGGWKEKWALVDDGSILPQSGFVFCTGLDGSTLGQPWGGGGTLRDKRYNFQRIILI